MHDQPNRPDFERLADAAEQWAQIAADALVLGRISVDEALEADVDAIRASANAARAIAVNDLTPPDEAAEMAHVAETLDRLLDEINQIGDE